jgi:hypothetical protein
MKETSQLLTKSLYVAAIKCPRLYWMTKNEQIPPPSLAERFRLEQGQQFEEAIKPLFKNAIFQKTKTKGNAKARADIIDKDNLYEVKASTKIKKEHLHDLAFQTSIFHLPSHIIHLNKEYTKDQPLKNLIKIHTPEELPEIKDIQIEEEPPARMTTYCRECILKKQCWKERPSIFNLTNHHLYWRLYNQGIEAIEDIPEDEKITERDRIIIQVHLEKKPHIDKEAIEAFLEKLTYPLNHLDFETYDTALPIHQKQRPYQKIPFQYSLHREEEDGSLTHKAFLADGKNDPRPALLKQLKADLTDTGDIIVYNKTFEITILKQLARDFPKEQAWLKKTIARIVDLADIFSKRFYYHPDQKGSYSIKCILPILTDMAYDGDIDNGADASILYFYSHIDETKPKEKMRANLKDYCRKDTLAMVKILESLRDIIR